MDHLHLSVFKYPLGAIRVVQFVFLVIALAAANSWHAELEFSCNNGTIIHKEETTTFSMSSHKFMNCKNETKEFWNGSWGGAAGFFYFTAVVTLIFVLIVTFSYVVLWQVYSHDKRIPLADLAVTGLLFVFWFFCTSIWWAAANGIGSQTGEDNVKDIISKGKDDEWGTFQSVNANNGMLAISVLSGWVLVATLAMDCWFIWKEVVPRSQNDPNEVA